MSARPGLCGGHRVTGVPTAIASCFFRYSDLKDAGARTIAVNREYAHNPATGRQTRLLVQRRFSETESTDGIETPLMLLTKLREGVAQRPA
jgi:hypothetical protein